MSAAAPSTSSPRTGVRTRVLAILVLIGLMALAAYTVFSGPTTVPRPAGPQAAPVQHAPPEPSEKDTEGGPGD